MTLAVLGLDAADYGLVQEWGYNNLQLNQSRQLTTESHSLEVPATIEVWPTIATGLGPDKHEVILNTADESASLPYQIAQQTVARLPTRVERAIVQTKESQVGAANPTTSASHVFEDGAVTNWPGITPCHDWSEEGDWFSALNDGDLSIEEFERRYRTHLGEQIGWLAGASAAGYPVAGIHIHYLDHMGHVYADRPDALRERYEVVDSFVGWLRHRVDDLLIVSDHGMQVSVLSDDEPGVHSWRALVSSTLDDDLPASVRDVAAWVRSQTAEEGTSESRGSVDAPTKHLEDLGYL